MTQTTTSIGREGSERTDEMPAVQDRLREVEDKLRETLRSVKLQMREADTRARALIQERPLLALAAAVAVGFMLRRLLPYGKG